MLLDFELDLGGIPDDNSPESCRHNAQVLSYALQHNASNNTLYIPFGKTFHSSHGVYATNVSDVIIQLDGVLRFERLDKKPYQLKHQTACFRIDRGHNITLTSTFRGVIDGRGSQYWGVPGIGYAQFAENRPELVAFANVTHLLIEQVIFQDSPYHTLKLEAVDQVEIRNVSIVARRTKNDGHTWVDLSAFNTDGIDISGHNVHIHDVDIWTQDDCIAVKDNYNSDSRDYLSSNMTFERINASGFGLVIGSISGSTVRNITFRDSYLHHTVKGIYLKFHTPDHFAKSHNLTGLIEDILFENISMEGPLQFSIFIGPAQQSDHRNFCHANPCSICWPFSPTAQCNVVGQSKYRNITIRNTRINNPKMSPGVILGSAEAPMEGLVFENVRVTSGEVLPYAKEDLTVTFPGLKQPIDDKYIPNSFQEIQFPELKWEMLDGWLFDSNDQQVENNSIPFDYKVNYFIPHMAVLLVSTYLLIQFSMYRSISASKTNHPDKRPHKLLLQHLVWGCLCLATVYFVYHYCSSYNILEFGRPKWQKTSSYFRCEGAHGIAKGTTWPVPDCFDQDPSPGIWAFLQ